MTYLGHFSHEDLLKIFPNASFLRGPTITLELLKNRRNAWLVSDTSGQTHLFDPSSCRVFGGF
jgi:hypothetical protein